MAGFTLFPSITRSAAVTCSTGVASKFPIETTFPPTRVSDSVTNVPCAFPTNETSPEAEVINLMLEVLPEKNIAEAVTSGV